MHFTIRHLTQYRYSRPVALDPHSLRVRPRQDGSQTLRKYTLEITPRPAGMTDFTDLEGNAACQMWFGELAESLSILVLAEVQTLRENPFDFVIAEPGIMTLPVRYPDQSRITLRPYCIPTQGDGPVAWYADEIARSTGYDTLRFLTALTDDIHQRTELVVRLTGEPQSAETTLKTGTGAGRDLAVLFLEACRTQGIAARFASGYWNGQAPDGKHYLHAWAEVYFPQCGWRGYDPSTGLAVADQHVPVSSGLYPGSAASVTGAFWGSDVQSSMETSLDVHAQ